MSATPPVYPAAPAPFPPPVPVKRKAIYKRVWFWLLVVFAVIVVAIAANTGSKTSTSSDTGNSAAAAPASTPAAATIGTAVRDGDFEFTVTGLDRGKTQLGTQYLNTTAQGEFVLVNLTVRNIGNEPGTLFDQNTKLYDTQGREFRPSSSAAIYLPDQSNAIAQSINPGNQLSGTIVFDVPAGTDLASIELHDSAFSGGASVSLG